MIATIKIKLTQKELSEIYKLYVWACQNFDADDMHEDLLLSHAQLMGHRIAELYRADQRRYGLKLNAPEAMAFYLFWNMVETGTWEYGTVILGRIIEQIDKLRIEFTRLNIAI